MWATWNCRDLVYLLIRSGFCVWESFLLEGRQWLSISQLFVPLNINFNHQSIYLFLDTGPGPGGIGSTLSKVVQLFFFPVTSSSSCLGGDPEALKARWDIVFDLPHGGWTFSGKPWGGILIRCLNSLYRLQFYLKLISDVRAPQHISKETVCLRKKGKTVHASDRPSSKVSITLHSVVHKKWWE